MKNNSIIVTQLDYQRLRQLAYSGDTRNKGSAENLHRLIMEIKKAKVVKPTRIDPDVVTMNTELELTDLDSNTTRRLKLVYPQQANIGRGYVSILAPVGTALLGYKKGDIIEWDVPSGKKRFLIKEILFQPEANGEDIF